MPLHNKHLHPRCPLLSNAKIPKIQFFSSLGTSKMANKDQKIELKENGLRKKQRKQDDKPKKQ